MFEFYTRRQLSNIMMHLSCSLAISWAWFIFHSDTNENINMYNKTYVPSSYKGCKAPAVPFALIFIHHHHRQMHFFLPHQSIVLSITPCCPKAQNLGPIELGMGWGWGGGVAPADQPKDNFCLKRKLNTASWWHQSWRDGVSMRSFVIHRSGLRVQNPVTLQCAVHEKQQTNNKI